MPADGSPVTRTEKLTLPPVAVPVTCESDGGAASAGVPPR